MGNRDLPPYLHADKAGFYIVHPTTRRKARLGTRDRKAALAIYGDVIPKIRGEVAKADAERIAGRLRAVALPRESSVSLADYCATFRADVLPGLTKKNGEPMGEKTRDDYGRMLEKQIEPSKAAAVALADADAMTVRAILKPWINKEAFYNHLKAALSRVFGHAVLEGLLPRNPVKDVDRRPTKKRKVTIQHDHYAAAMSHLHDWQAMACDLLYLIAARPGDTLRLTEDDFERWDAPKVVELDDGRSVRLWGVLRYRASKNKAPVEIEVNDALNDVLTWFMEWKRDRFIISRHFVVFPPRWRGGMQGKPVTVESLSRHFQAAVRAAGIPAGTYSLRDIRPTGLTDDWLEGGDGAKGGHKTEQMKQHYRRAEVPFRATNTLSAIRR